jgi:hypothetical protein
MDSDAKRRPGDATFQVSMNDGKKSRDGFACIPFSQMPEPVY